MSRRRRCSRRQAGRLWHSVWGWRSNPGEPGRQGRDPAADRAIYKGSNLMFRPLAIALLISMLTTIVTAQDGKIPFEVVPLPPALGLPEGHANFVIRSAEEWYVWANKLSSAEEPLPTVDFE